MNDPVTMVKVRKVLRGRAEGHPLFSPVRASLGLLQTSCDSAMRPILDRPNDVTDLS